MNSTVLEVAVGLALVFYITATLVTGVAEGLTRLVNLRSKTLWAFIARMLSAPGTPGSPKSLGVTFALGSFVPHLFDRRPVSQTTSFTPAGGDVTAPLDVRLKELAGTASIAGLEYVRPDWRTKVLDIPGKVFAAAMLELATVKSEQSTTVQDRLKALADEYSGSPLGGFLGSVAVEVGNDVDKVTDAIAAWFDQQMARVTQTYRKNMKYVLAVLGLVVVVLCNVDTLAVGRALASDASLREVVSATAGDLTEEDITAKCTLDEAQTKQAGDDPTRKTLLCGLNSFSDLRSTGIVIPTTDTYGEQLAAAWNGDDRAAHLLGLALTTGAVSLGGPMWFDFLMLLTGRKRSAA